MASVWSVLGKPRMEALIGGTILDRLEILLPALKPSEFDKDKLYSKDGLANIFNAFSGGTSLLKEDFRHELFNALPEPTINELVKATGVGKVNMSFADKVAKLAKKGWKDAEFAEKVTEVLRLPKDYIPRETSLPVQQLLIPAAEKPYKTLKDYQTSVFFEARKKLQIDRSRFIVQMPTGSGKTRTGMEIISSFLNESPVGACVLWLAHSEELCEQAYDSFVEVWPHVASKPLRLVRSWGADSSLPFEFSESAFIVGSFQKLYALLSKNDVPFRELRSKMGLIIVDEAHKVLAPTYTAVTKAFLGDHTRVIGLTATPGRSAVDAEQNAALAEFFFNQVVTIHTTKKSVIQYLREQKVLSKTTYDPLISHRDFQLSAKEKSHLEQFFDLPPGILRRIADDDLRNVEIVKRLERECANGSQIIFFACNIEHSKFICALLVFLGIRAAHVDGAIPRNLRSSLIEDFKARKLQVICNYGVLSTGFDAPKTDVVFIARPTGSIVLYSQMIGRGLRGPAIGGTETCRVIDVKDNIDGFSDENAVFDYFADYYES